MGFFDKILSSANVMTAKPVINNEQEAFLTIITAAASADGDIEAEEWDTIYDTLFQKKMFNTVDVWKLIDEVKGNIKAYVSLADAVNECAPLIKNEHKQMVFTVCVDMVLIDGQISTNEQAIVEHLKTSLNISDDFAMKTVEVMLSRNFGNA